MPSVLPQTIELYLWPATRLLLLCLTTLSLFYLFLIVFRRLQSEEQDAVKASPELLRSRTWWTKANALTWLADTNPDLKVQKQMAALLDDRRVEVRLAALAALSQIRSPKLSASETISTVFSKNGSDLSQFVTLQLFNAQTPPSSLEPLFKSETVWKRRSAALLLAREKFSPQSQAMLEQLAEDVQTEVRKAAVYALGETQAEKALSILAQSKNDDCSSVRAETAKTLGKIDSHESLGSLEELTEDCSFEVRLEAFLSLSNFGEGGRQVINQYRNQCPELAREANLRSYWKTEDDF